MRCSLTVAVANGVLTGCAESVSQRVVACSHFLRISFNPYLDASCSNTCSCSSTSHAAWPRRIVSSANTTSVNGNGSWNRGAHLPPRPFITFLTLDDAANAVFPSAKSRFFAELVPLPSFAFISDLLDVDVLQLKGGKTTKCF